MRRLEDFDSTEISKFLNSFDTILTDCDGVLWRGHTLIEGSMEALNKLQSLGKKIFFVSNNSTHTVDKLCETIRKLGYAARPNSIALPASAICWYLKKIGFNGKAYVLGTKTFRRVLQNEGIDVTEPAPDVLEERIDAVMRHIKNAPRVDAVVVDVDINISWSKMTRAIEYLKNRDVLYLTGAYDRHIVINEGVTILGIADFIETISRESNRRPVEFGKPSEVMKNYVTETFDIVDPSRCIFVGDSLDTDMKFADICGFSKLLVGSGIHSLDEIISRQISDVESNSSIPHYYLPSLGCLSPILDEFITLDRVDDRPGIGPSMATDYPLMAQY